VLSWAKDSIIPTNATNSGYRREAGGLRSCNGMGSDGMGTMLIADNQGSFVPQTPIHMYRAGQPLRTYGKRQATVANAYGFTPAPTNTTRNWAEDLPYQPPVIWIPDNVGQSGSQPFYLDRGPYKGDWLVGDVNAPALGRLHLDNVDGSGNYQASLHLFTSGIDNATSGTSPGKAINRMTWSPDSAIYVGTLLNRGDWPSGAAGPMTRIAFRDSAAFEVLAVRSRKNAAGDSNGVEIFFSQPLNPATAIPSNFALYQLAQILTANYGCVGSTGRPCFSQVPQVTGLTLSHDHRKVFLTIATPDTSIGASHIGTIGVGPNPVGVWGGAGKQDRTLRVDVSTSVTSATGEILFYYRQYMGWNWQSNTRFDPANTDVIPSPIRENTRVPRHLASVISMRAFPGVLNVRVALEGKYTVSLYSVSGALREEKSVSPGGSREHNFNTQSLGRGVHIVRVKQGSTVYSRPVTF
jgi:hypothetical protein